MSGTSADGIDVAIAEIDGPYHNLSIRPIGFESHPWPEAERGRLFRLFTGEAPTSLICQANFSIAESFAKAALATIDAVGLSPTQVDLIGSHGQTIWHDVASPTESVDEFASALTSSFTSPWDTIPHPTADPYPDKSATAKGTVTSTLQIGDPSVIAARTGITTVANFRPADVAVGGQGAPLVSILDWLLLRPEAGLNGATNGWRAIQNIGGIGNVTLLPPLGRDESPLAFDTGPGNALIDWAVTTITEGKELYDVDGIRAGRGQVDGSLLEEWMSHSYFNQVPPKSTGRELFSQALYQQWQLEAANRGVEGDDFIATITEVTAASIASAYADFAPGPIAQVVLAGGGANNPHLRTRIAEQLYGALGYRVEVLTHESLGIDGDAKEALTFGLLAYLTLHGWPGNVPVCTGAAREQILGQIAPGANWGNLLMSHRVK